jgi:hypothetical protein
MARTLYRVVAPEVEGQPFLFMPEGMNELAFELEHGGGRKRKPRCRNCPLHSRHYPRSRH